MHTTVSITRWETTDLMLHKRTEKKKEQLFYKTWPSLSPSPPPLSVSCMRYTKTAAHHEESVRRDVRVVMIHIKRRKSERENGTLLLLLLLLLFGRGGESGGR